MPDKQLTHEEFMQLLQQQEKARQANLAKLVNICLQIEAVNQTKEVK